MMANYSPSESLSTQWAKALCDFGMQFNASGPHVYKRGLSPSLKIANVSNH
jgi:hypothetical protein